MKIRSAKEEDLPKIMKLKDMKDEQRILGRMQKAEEGQVTYLVAEDNGEIIGHVLVKFYGKDSAPEYPDIEDAYVLEKERSKGIGSELIKEAEKVAKEKGFKKIGLAVNPTLNPKAKALYERLGYKETGELAYLDGIYDGTEDWVVDMVKILD